MRVFFWDFDDTNDIERQWSMFALNFLVLAYTVKAFIGTYRFYQSFVFELVPLTLNIITTFLLLLLKLFEKGYEFDRIAFALEVFTYFLFSYIFVFIYLRTTKYLPGTELAKKICNYLLGLALGLLIVTIILICVLFTHDCNQQLLVAAFIGLTCQVASFCVTIYFGKKILDNLEKSTLQSVALAEAQNTLLDNTLSYQVLKQRKRQIYFVFGSYVLSLVLRLVTTILRNVYSEQVVCQQFEGVYIVTSDYAVGQFILIMMQICQLIPHAIIPIALYTVPNSKRASGQISLNANVQADSDEEDFTKADQKVTSLISSTYYTQTDSVATS